LLAIATTATDYTSTSPLQTEIVTTFAGLLFAGIGFLLVTDYKGGRRRILDGSVDLTVFPAPDRRALRGLAGEVP
jgi:hypothetical protein